MCIPCWSDKIQSDSKTQAKVGRMIWRLTDRCHGHGCYTWWNNHDVAAVQSRILSAFTHSHRSQLCCCLHVSISAAILRPMWHNLGISHMWRTYQRSNAFTHFTVLWSVLATCDCIQYRFKIYWCITPTFPDVSTLCCRNSCHGICNFVGVLVVQYVLFLSIVEPVHKSGLRVIYFRRISSTLAEKSRGSSEKCQLSRPLPLAQPLLS